jgi:hypothetical protein
MLNPRFQLNFDVSLIIVQQISAASFNKLEEEIKFVSKLALAVEAWTGRNSAAHAQGRQNRFELRARNGRAPRLPSPFARLRLRVWRAW